MYGNEIKKEIAISQATNDQKENFKVAIEAIYDNINSGELSSEYESIVFQAVDQPHLFISNNLFALAEPVEKATIETYSKYLNGYSPIDIRNKTGYLSKEFEKHFFKRMFGYDHTICYANEYPVIIKLSFFCDENYKIINQLTQFIDKLKGKKQGDKNKFDFKGKDLNLHNIENERKIKANNKAILERWLQENLEHSRYIDTIEIFRHNEYITFVIPGKKPEIVGYDPNLSSLFDSIRKKHPQFNLLKWDFREDHAKCLLRRLSPEIQQPKSYTVYCRYCGNFITQLPFNKTTRQKYCKDGLCKGRYRKFKDMIMQLYKSGRISKKEMRFYTTPGISIYHVIKYMEDSERDRINEISNFKSGMEFSNNGIKITRYCEQSNLMYCWELPDPKKGGQFEYSCLDIKNNKKSIRILDSSGFEFTDVIEILRPRFKILESGDIALIKSKYCLFCGKELTGKRSKSKYCSDECRYRYHNRKKVKI